MAKQKLALFVLITLLISILSPVSFILTEKNHSSNSNLILNSETGVSNYEITQSVTYQVEINYTLTNIKSPFQNYFFKVARLNDRQPNSSLTQYCAPYQQSQLLYNSITGYDTFISGSIDKFNNTYDLFNATLYPSDIITLNQKYLITLNEVTFGAISSTDIGTYNTSSAMFDLYCNNSEIYYERDNLDLINVSQSIVNINDTAIEKARKIAEWVSGYLTYDGTLPNQEMGALWAYNNKRGDCSEYSTLMITLLRIQGIPARKVTGFLISSNPTFRPEIGQTFNFYANSPGSSNILGHAWVEYYIPNIGWIQCEPQNPQYYKKIDYLRFNFNIGAWFFMPGAFPIQDISEFPPIPSPVCADHTDAYTYNYNMHITIIDTNYTGFDFLVLLIIIGVVAVVMITIILLIRSGKRKQKEIINY